MEQGLILARRRFLFAAPAVIAASALMKPSTLIKSMGFSITRVEIPPPLDPIDIAIHATYPPRATSHRGLDPDIFRQLIEPVLNEYFKGVYEDEVVGRVVRPLHALRCTCRACKKGQALRSVVLRDMRRQVRDGTLPRR